MPILTKTNLTRARRSLASAFLLAAFVAPAPASAQGGQLDLETLLGPGSPDELVAAFREICFEHRTSWDAMIRAAETSRFELEPMDGEEDEPAFMAFPLMVSFKRLDDQRHYCLAQSQVAATLTEAQLVAKLRGAEPGMAGADFEDSPIGLATRFEQDGLTGMVGVEIVDAEPLPIAQLVLTME